MKFQNTGRNGFYDSVRSTLLMGRILGVVPIGGLLNNTSVSARFIWKTPYTLILAMVLIFNVVSICFRIYDNIRTNFELRRIVELIYDSIHLISPVLLVYNCARYWNKLLKKIETAEKTLPPLNVGSNIEKINKLIAIMFLCAIVDILLFQLFMAISVKYCSLLEDDSGWYIKSYLVTVQEWYFNYMPFNYFLGFLLGVFGHLKFVQWVFFDVLIMALSMYLLKLFENFNQALTRKLKTNQIVSPNNMSWPELQNYYTRLMQIVKTVDRFINPFVFISFVFNLIYIGQIMYNIFNKRVRNDEDSNANCFIIHKYDWHRIIFMIFTSTFALSRIVLVSFLAAQLHTNSRLPLNYLHTMPTAAYNREAQRFFDQVYHAKVGLSGLELFLVTREMLLTSLATLITYELVLLQFK